MKNTVLLLKRLLVPILILSVLLVVTGCGSRPEVMDASDSSGIYNQESMAERGMAGEVAPVETASPAPGDITVIDGEGLSLGGTLEIGHKVIYTGEVVLESLEFESSIEGIQRYVNSIGGYAESSFVEGRRISETARPSRRTTVFTFRIPQQRFISFSDNLKEFGNVLSSSTHGENITERYFDTEARLISLQIQEERMLSLLEKAENIEDLLRIESELTHLRYQIESFTGTLQKWDNLVQFSTVRVEVREVDQVTPDPETATWFDEIGEAFKESVLAVIKTLQNMVILFIMAVPFLLVFIPVLLLLRKLYDLYRNRKKNNTSSDKKLQ